MIYFRYFSTQNGHYELEVKTEVKKEIVRWSQFN